TFWTGSMMLDHLGEHDGARRLMHAIERVTASEVHTPDLGGSAKTVDVTKAVRKAILDAAKSGTQQLQPLKQLMALKRPRWSTGTVVILEHDSKVLADNPLGDPHARKLAVWLPAEYEDRKSVV